MRKSTSAAWWWLTLPPAALAGWFLGTRCHEAVRGPTSDLGVGREQVQTPAEPLGGISSSSASQRTAADAHLSPAGAWAEPSRADAGGPPARSDASAGVLPLDLDDGMLPTPEGLYALSAGLWEQPEFLEAAGLDMLDLPTEGDCVRALEDPEALRRLELAQLATIIMARIDATPTRYRDWRFAANWEVAMRGAECAEKALMERLDASLSNSYRRWAEVHARYLEWAR